MGKMDEPGNKTLLCRKGKKVPWGGHGEKKVIRKAGDKLGGGGKSSSFGRP